MSRRGSRYHAIVMMLPVGVCLWLSMGTTAAALTQTSTPTPAPTSTRTPTVCPTGTPCTSGYYKVCSGEPVTNCNCNCQPTPVMCPGGDVLDYCGFGVCICVSPTPIASPKFTQTPTPTSTPVPTGNECSPSVPDSCPVGKECLCCCGTYVCMPPYLPCCALPCTESTPLPTPTATPTPGPTGVIIGIGDVCEIDVFCPLPLLCLIDPPHQARVCSCVGDCDESAEVTVDELVTLVNVDLGSQGWSACPLGDANSDGEVTVDEILLAVDHALYGCLVEPTPTPTPRLEGVAQGDPQYLRGRQFYQREGGHEEEGGRETSTQEPPRFSSWRDIPPSGDVPLAAKNRCRRWRSSVTAFSRGQLSSDLVA
jgi:hypothetical protein